MLSDVKRQAPHEITGSKVRSVRSALRGVYIGIYQAILSAGAAEQTESDLRNEKRNSLGGLLGLADLH